MGSSTNKGNISNLMTVITTLAIVLIVVILASVMVINAYGPGRYKDPVVASHVVRGTIHDRNGRILAMEVPANNLYIKADPGNADMMSQILASAAGFTPDSVKSAIASAQEGTIILLKSDLDTAVADSIRKAASDAGMTDLIDMRKENVRTYPAGFHAGQLISETESVLSGVLSPNPGYDENTTYGDDVYLTIDLDIQYLLDLAVQQVAEVQHPDYAVGILLDIRSGDVLALTTYPFYDPNESSSTPGQQKVSRALVSSISSPTTGVVNTKVLSKVVSHADGSEISDYVKNGDYTVDLSQTAGLVRVQDGYTASKVLLPEDNPRYILFIGSVNPRFYQISSVLTYAVNSVKEGLEAQRKL